MNSHTTFLPSSTQFLAERRDVKRWAAYDIVDEDVHPSNDLETAGTTAQVLQFRVPDYGMFNKAAVQIKITCNDDGGDSSNNADWAGLQFINKATLYCGTREIYSLDAATIVALTQQSSATDAMIYMTAIPYKPTLDNVSTGVQYTFYAPLPFGCFEDIHGLLDTQVVQDLRLEVSMRAASDVLTNDSQDFTLDSVILKSQFLVVEDYPAWYKQASTRAAPVTKDIYTEHPFMLTGTKDQAYTSPRIRLRCNKISSHTYILLSVSGRPGQYLEGVRLDSVTVWDGDKVIHKTESDIEQMLMHHTEYRNHSHLKDNTMPNAAATVYILNWGVFSTQALSNWKDLSASNLFLSFTAVLPHTPAAPATTVEYTAHISHDYYKKVSFNAQGGVAGIES